MIVDRRRALKLAVAGAFCSALPLHRSAAEPIFPVHGEGYTRYDLANGLRVHCCRSRSRHINAGLLLRSKEITAHGGLAHIMEHTSFTGAAGQLTARELKQKRKAVIQEGNAFTAPGVLGWYASFLPKYASEALELLAITSLNQRFDVETVSSEVRIILQELFLDKYSSAGAVRRRVQAVLYGPDHPFGRDTLEAEIAKARTPARKLITELQDFAATIRLPSNMDLILVGESEPGRLRDIAEEHFGHYPHAAGPMLELPRTGPVRAYQTLSGTTGDLRRPLTETRITWNTGVAIGDPDAPILAAMSECLNEAIFAELREKRGDTYSPEVSYEPSTCGGVFTISVTSDKKPGDVEKRIFQVFEQIRSGGTPLELENLVERWELRRGKTADSADLILENMIARVVDGCALEDLDISSVSPSDIAAAARKYLPEYRGAYIRLGLLGS